jgi:hypothetical protein
VDRSSHFHDTLSRQIGQELVVNVCPAQPGADQTGGRENQKWCKKLLANHFKSGYNSKFILGCSVGQSRVPSGVFVDIQEFRPILAECLSGDHPGCTSP